MLEDTTQPRCRFSPDRFGSVRFQQNWSWGVDKLTKRSMGLLSAWTSPEALEEEESRGEPALTNVMPGQGSRQRSAETPDAGLGVDQHLTSTEVDPRAWMNRQSLQEQRKNEFAALPTLCTKSTLSKCTDPGDFPGGPVVGMPHSHRTGHGFDSWPRN